MNNPSRGICVMSRGIQCCPVTYPVAYSDVPWHRDDRRSGQISLNPKFGVYGWHGGLLEALWYRGLLETLGFRN